MLLFTFSIKIRIPFIYYFVQMLVNNLNATPLPRRYKAWKGLLNYSFICNVNSLSGNNNFMLWGVLMTGSHCHQALLTSWLIILTWGFYIVLALPYLHLHVLYKISFTVLSVNITTLVLTMFTEPGVIPRICNVHRQRQFMDLKMVSYVARNAALFNYCTICQIVRPPRSRHCRFCDNCVQHFDHHW